MLWRTLMPPNSYVEGGTRWTAETLEKLGMQSLAVGPDLGLLTAHLAAIAVATIFLAYALQPQQPNRFDEVSG